MQLFFVKFLLLLFKWVYFDLFGIYVSFCTYSVQFNTKTTVNVTEYVDENAT